MYDISRSCTWIFNVDFEVWHNISLKQLTFESEVLVADMLENPVLLISIFLPGCLL